ncbi:hypothetical protein [Nitratifractor sp.]
MNSQEPTITLRADIYAQLLETAGILGLDPQECAQKALEAFFTEVHRQMGAANPDDDNLQTNLSYDEFWDGVEL